METDRTIAATLGAAPESGSGESRGLERGDVVDRYLLLDRLGAGAMGVVYAAFDPELDRKVALKLLAPEVGPSPGSAGRTRLLREAQALARLSHPNVVAVHDAGTHGEQVWIAMELVTGATLRGWADERRRSWSELVPVLTDVARGVAAAHAVGLVHRDLKPENVMIGSDGRVRVMDFGLAHGRGREPGDLPLATTLADSDAARPGLAALGLRLTQAGAIQGTPAYMAPEQWHGQEVGAAADQFGWSVMAWELLYGERPFAGETMLALAAAVLAGQRRPPPSGRRIPRWLRAMVERGLAVEPMKRWPTMLALIAALERGKRGARVKTIALALAGVAVIGGGAAAMHRQDLAQRIAGCEAAGAEIDEVWNEAVRGGLRRTFMATGASQAGTTADKVIPWLDREAAAWQRARTEVCMNVELRGSWTADTLERGLWCLDDRRTALDSLVAEFGRADAMVVQRAATAVSSLGAVDPCVDEGFLRSQPSPPGERREAVREIRGELSRAVALGYAGRFREGLQIAATARERAEALAWRPLVAEARLREGRLLTDLSLYEQAEVVMQDAYFEAASLGLWDIAGEAATLLIRAVGEKLARHAEGRAWVRHAAVAAAHAGDPEGLREAQRLHNLANVQMSAGLYTEARTLYERALALRERALGPEHPDLTLSRNNLATIRFAMGDYADALALFERTLTVREAALGPEHPLVAESLNNMATVHHVMREYAGARALYERALAIQERALGPEHTNVADTLNNLASVHSTLGAYARARALHERALNIRERALGPDHPDVGQSLDNLGSMYIAMGEPAQAQALLERGLTIVQKALGPDHPDVASVLNNLARIHLALHEPRRALPLLEQAVGIYDAHAGEQQSELDARANLAAARAAVAALTSGAAR